MNQWSHDIDGPNSVRAFDHRSAFLDALSIMSKSTASGAPKVLDVSQWPPMVVAGGCGRGGCLLRIDCEGKCDGEDLHTAVVAVPSGSRGADNMIANYCLFANRSETSSAAQSAADSDCPAVGSCHCGATCESVCESAPITEADAEAEMKRQGKKLSDAPDASPGHPTYDGRRRIYYTVTYGWKCAGECTMDSKPK